MNFVSNQLRVETSGGGHAILLNKVDLILFQQLIIHRSLTSREIHEIYHAVDRRSASGVSNRLRRLKNAGLLVRQDDFSHIRPHPFFQFHYRLGKKAFEALAAGGFIDESEATRIYDIHRNYKPQKIHNQAVSSLANDIWGTFLKEYELSISHQRGSEVDIVKVSETNIIPDWVFEFGNTKVFLEVDTGSERPKRIVQKSEGYIQLAKEIHPAPLHVVFSVVDVSVDSRLKGVSRHKRVISIKNALPAHTDLPENLHFHVVSFLRSKPLVIRLLLSLQPAKKSLKQSTIKSWLKRYNHLLGGCELTEIENSLFYPPRIYESQQADKIYQISDGEQAFNAAFIFGEEGSLQTDQAIYQHRRWMDEGLIEIEQIIVIYADEDQALEDIIQTRDARIFFSYRHTEKHLVQVYYAKSLQTKEVVDYASITSTEN